MGVFGYIIPMFVIYFGLILAMGVYHSKKIKDSDDFLVSGRNVGFLLLTGTIVGTHIGGGTLIGFTAEAYEIGVAALWPILPSFFFMAIWIIFFVRYINRIRQVTLPDFLVLRFGEKVRVPSAIFTMFRSIVLTGMQILAMSSIMSAVIGWDVTTSIIISFLVTTVYCLLGGLHTVIVTDAIQSLIQIIGPIILLVILIIVIGDTGTLYERTIEINPDFWNIWEPGWAAILGFIAASGPYYLVYQPMWQRVYAAKDESTAFKSMSWAMVISFISIFVPIFIGIAANLVAPPDLAASEILPWLYLDYFTPWLGAFFAVSLIAAIMSVMDSMVLDGTANFVRDIYQKRINAQASEKQLIRMGRISVIAISTLGLVMALALQDLVVLWVFANALAAGGIVIPALAAWFSKRATSTGAFWSIVGGGIGTIMWAIIAWINTGNPGSAYLGISPVYVGFAASLILIIILSKNTPHSPEENPGATLYSENSGKSLNKEAPMQMSLENAYNHFMENPMYRIKR